MSAPVTLGLALRSAAIGIAFGVVATHTQVISWYRIQEMFRFDSFHMYGVLMSAVAVAALSVAVIRRLGVRAIDGEPIVIADKEMGSGRRYWIGGGLFGLGWGLAGACPGPIFALMGAGVAGAWVILAGALAGTWFYSLLRPKLPH